MVLIVVVVASFELGTFAVMSFKATVGLIVTTSMLRDPIFMFHLLIIHLSFNLMVGIIHAFSQVPISIAMSNLEFNLASLEVGRITQESELQHLTTFRIHNLEAYRTWVGTMEAFHMAFKLLLHNQPYLRDIQQLEVISNQELGYHNSPLVEVEG